MRHLEECLAQTKCYVSNGYHGLHCYRYLSIAVKFISKINPPQHQQLVTFMAKVAQNVYIQLKLGNERKVK